MASARDSVAEMQGLYGPFTVAERVVQKIWLRQDFSVQQARLEDGRSLEILSPGHWNLIGGPDFQGARLRLGGIERSGDVEVHFHASDWEAHGHREDPAYANVVLHVLLFPPGPREKPVRNPAGGTIPAFVLLPRLHRDLEEYAADDALEELTARDEWTRTAELASRPVGEVRELLRELAVTRWRAKVHSAAQRVARLGWAAAAHHTGLEILGYRHNRVPMLMVAERWPLTAWQAGVDLASVHASVGDAWRLHGVRPANRPSLRLAQYAAWVQRRPDWPEQLEQWARSLPELPDVPTADPDGSILRRARSLGALSADLNQRITGGAVGGLRWHTLVCDGLLPLAAGQSGRDLSALWLPWFPGDAPERIARALRKLGVSGGRDQPHCHGFAQGLMAWFLRRDVSL